MFKLAEIACEYIQCDQPKREDVLTFDGYIGGGYGVPTEGMKKAVKLMATKEGILLDPVYSGKAFNGLLDLVSKKYFKDIDVIINNAGIGYNCFVTDIDKKIANEVFQINFFTILETNKLFLNSMIKKNKCVDTIGGSKQQKIGNFQGDCDQKISLEIAVFLTLWTSID